MSRLWLNILPDSTNNETNCLRFTPSITNIDVYTVIDVAYNPDILQAAEKDQVKKNQLIRMAMKCIEEQFQFTLSHFYHITNFKIKGSIQRMKQNLMGIQTDPTYLREKMRKGKLMNVNGKLN